MEKGDHIELELPMQPRLITANKAVENLRGQVALASGPIITVLRMPIIRNCRHSNFRHKHLWNSPMTVICSMESISSNVRVIFRQKPSHIMLWPTGKRAIAIKYGFLRNKSQTIPTNKFIQDEKKVSPLYVNLRNENHLNYRLSLWKETIVARVEVLPGKEQAFLQALML